MESKIGSTLAYTGVGTIIGATIMRKIDDLYINNKNKSIEYKPNENLIKTLQQNNSIKKTELETDIYVTGSKFLKSVGPNKQFYSYKKKEENIEDFIKSDPEFVTSDKLLENSEKVAIDDVVKLIIKNDSTLFVESDASVTHAQNVSGIIVDPCKEFNFVQLDCGKLKL